MRSFLLTVRGAVASIPVLLAAGCSQVIAGQPNPPAEVEADHSLVVDYFERGNAAAGEGVEAQRQFLRQTQHPDFTDQDCDLGSFTLRIDPTLSTLRPDIDWRPQDSAETPRGRVYVVAVTVTVQREQATVGVQIGSVHVVVLDGAAYGFAPCPA